VTAPSFERILEEQLSACWQASRPSAAAVLPGPPDLGLLLVMRGLPGWNPTGRRRATSYDTPPAPGSQTAGSGTSSSSAGNAAPGSARDTADPAAGVGDRAAARRRSSPAWRPLDAREARALATFRALGGDDLDPQALEHDLRRVFRRLARRYHPDRHPGLDGPARAALAARFATLVEAYRVLARRTRPPRG